MYHVALADLAPRGLVSAFMPRANVDTDRLYRELRRIVGDSRVSTVKSELEPYSRDMWPRLLIAQRSGAVPASLPHAVVWPETTREVSNVIRLARQLRIPTIPYGGGSGVCGGTVPISGGITIDLKRMNRFLSVDRTSMTTSVEAGMNGERFERELNRRGYTAGHFPSSIYCSTVGGWVACRAAGQMSAKYGKIEDRIAGLTVVTGRGEIVRTDGFMRAHRGPNWTQLLVGSEGTFGVITGVRLRVASIPALRIFRGFEFESVEQGLEGIRGLMQKGLRPAVVRLYDEFDTFVHTISGKSETRASLPAAKGALPMLPGARPSPPPNALARARGWFSKQGSLASSLKREAISLALSRPRLTNLFANQISERFSKTGCLLIVGLEGAAIRTEVEARLTFGELERAGGEDLGEEPGRKWFEHRYSVSYGMSRVFREGAFVDTMEVASTWERLPDLYQSVRTAIGEHALVMAHFSHAYTEGCSIYFTFVGHGNNRQESERLYDQIWRDGMKATTGAGGTISHHHGVGLLKSAWMKSEHREAMTVLEALKQSLDPDNIANPGKLGLRGRG